MSINWVMIDARDFVRLPGEKPVYKSPPRTALALTTPKTYPANSPVSIHSDAGTLYLTNQRIVYLPAKPSEGFQSFSCPLLNLHDSHVSVPWFGPNAWQALVQPVPGGNLPAASTGIELKLTFKEGGAPDFHSNFERIKERLQQALEAAHDSGEAVQRQAGFLQGVNMDSVHLDQLPTYEASGHDQVATTANSTNPTVLQDPEPSVITTASTVPSQPPTQVSSTAPDQNLADAPPGYEETQQQSLQQELDRRFSGH